MRPYLDTSTGLLQKFEDMSATRTLSPTEGAACRRQEAKQQHNYHRISWQQPSTASLERFTHPCILHFAHLELNALDGLIVAVVHIRGTCSDDHGTTGRLSRLGRPARQPTTMLRKQPMTMTTFFDS